MLETSPEVVSMVKASPGSKRVNSLLRFIQHLTTNKCKGMMLTVQCCFKLADSFEPEFTKRQPTDTLSITLVASDHRTKESPWRLALSFKLKSRAVVVTRSL